MRKTKKNPCRYLIGYGDRNGCFYGREWVLEADQLPGIASPFTLAAAKKAAAVHLPSGGGKVFELVEIKP